MGDTFQWFVVSASNFGAADLINGGSAAAVAICTWLLYRLQKQQVALQKRQEEHFLATERGYVAIGFANDAALAIAESSPLTKLNPVRRRKITVDLAAKSCGNTPVTVRRIALKVVSQGPDGTATLHEDRFTMAHPVVPGEEVRHSGTFEVVEGELARFLAGDRALAVLIEVDYADVFGDTHRVTAARVLQTYDWLQKALKLGTSQEVGGDKLQYLDVPGYNQDRRLAAVAQANADR